MEQPDARTIRSQPPEMIHLEHCDSRARMMPTRAAGMMARPVMANKVTPERLVLKYLVDMK
jgi:hypothetical protein